MIELAEYALYQCCIDDHYKEDNQTKYSFEIIDDYKTSDQRGSIGIRNPSFPSEESGFRQDNNEHDHDKWLQPKYFKDNDVLQLLVSISSSYKALCFKDCF